MTFALGDKVIADDRRGYRIDDGVIIEIVNNEHGWPYAVRSESHGGDWPYAEDELTLR